MTDDEKIQNARDILSRYNTYVKQVVMLHNRLAEIEEDINNPPIGGQGSGVSSGSVSLGAASLIFRKDELECEIEIAEQGRREFADTISEVFRRMETTDGKTYLKMQYLYGLTNRQIMQETYSCENTILRRKKEALLEFYDVADRSAFLLEKLERY